MFGGLVCSAAAIPIANQIAVDGVVEWHAGDTVYSVVQPMGDGRSVLLHYDISGLLARRTRATGIAPERRRSPDHRD